MPTPSFMLGPAPQSSGTTPITAVVAVGLIVIAALLVAVGVAVVILFVLRRKKMAFFRDETHLSDITNPTYISENRLEFYTVILLLYNRSQY